MTEKSEKVRRLQRPSAFIDARIAAGRAALPLRELAKNGVVSLGTRGTNREKTDAKSGGEGSQARGRQPESFAATLR